MSRAKHSDSPHAVQLFPFVAVLLCTMGSLLVLLVSVARSSKDRAAVEAVAAQAEARAAAAAAQAAEEQQDGQAAREELEKIAKYQAEIDSVRADAAKQLRQDQLRLSHLEDHMRRLREQLESLQLAATELNALEGEHVQDRNQAESEIARLEHLIAESLNEIEQLRAEVKARAKSFAIVPFQGQHGTFRRPIYIECGPQEIVIQPEGVIFTIDDFQPPIGPGNPLVAALRAAREHFVASSLETGKAAEPYPLIIVRPDGIEAYYYVREAIQSWDSEFGYELVEKDWDLKFSAADPQLAVKEQAAADLARNRLRALAAAAPQAFAAYRPGAGAGGGGGGSRRGGFASGFGNGAGAPRGPGDADEEDLEYEVAELPAGGPRLASRPGGPAVAVIAGGGTGQSIGTTSGSAGPGSTPSSSDTSGNSSDPNGLSDDRYATKPAGQGGAKSSGDAKEGDPKLSGGGPRPLGAKPQSLENVERRPDGAPTPGEYSAGDDAEAELDELARAAAGEEPKLGEYHKQRKTRGKNWAIASGRPGTIPIRRSIQIVVRRDAVAILPEASPSKEASSLGKEFKFANAPDEAYEGLISAVEKRIQNWGIAGEGLYWRPVVELKVSPQCEAQLDELMRYLKFSGVEIQNEAVAQHVEGGTAGASR